MNWRKRKLGELVDNFSVRAKDAGGAKGLEFYGVSNDKGIIKTKYAAEEKAENYKIIEKDCFAYNPYRVNVGSIGLVDDHVRGLISPAYVVFKPKPNTVIPELLLKYLKSSEGLHQIRFYGRGTVRQALRFEDLCKIELSLPDYEEQVVLFEKLNRIQIESEKVAVELDQQQDIVKQLRQAFLREAMQGKLVEQDPKDGNAKDLLEAIKSEKEKLVTGNKTKKEKFLPSIEPEEFPFDIPGNWVWCRLGELAEISSGVTLGKKYQNETTEYKYLRVANVQRDQLKLDEIKTINIPSKDAEKILLKKNDLLIIEGNGSINEIGRCSIWNNEIDECIHQNHIIRVRLQNVITSYFILSYLNSPNCKDQMKRLAITTTGLYTLSVGKINNLPIPLPTLFEQDRIVKRLEEIMSICDESQQRILQSKNENNLLMQTLLNEALGIKSPIENIKEEKGTEKIKRFFIDERGTMNRSNMNIIQILQTSEEPISAKVVWKSSEYVNDIEAFYAELKRLVDDKKLVIEEKQGRDSFLKLVTNEN